MPVYCKGKGGICTVPCTNEACRHYDGTGAKCIPTVVDRLRSMTDLEWVDAIESFLPLLMEAGDKKIVESICDMQGDCGKDGNCTAQRHRACIMRFLLRPAETFGDDDRESGLLEGSDADMVVLPSIVKYENPYSGFWFRVHPETVGQYTGKTDKNGRKVFEHDILQTYTIWENGSVEKAGAGIVQWCEHDQCYVLVTKEGHHIDDFGNLGRPEYYEVVGNIHDNPDLLE